MIALYWPAFVVAFVITVTEMTEVVALVFALSADHRTVAHGGAGAVVGIAVVALVALSLGALLLRLPAAALLWAAAIALAAFGVFLFRSTLRSYRAARRGPTPATSPTRTRDAVQFAAGVSIGAIEATETVIVLLALTAAGYAGAALLGAVLAGAVLVGATLVVHQRIRRIKGPWLKWGATSMLFTFAVFWGGEAAGVAWPGGDLFLLALFGISLGAVRGAIELALRANRSSAAPA